MKTTVRRKVGPNLVQIERAPMDHIMMTGLNGRVREVGQPIHREDVKTIIAIHLRHLTNTTRIITSKRNRRDEESIEDHME